MRRFVARFHTLAMAMAMGGALVLTIAAGSLAASNPSGHGQPGAECGSPGAELMPHGFTTTGFAHAESVYAGSEGSASLLHSKSTHAVSQYDVACFQVTSNSH